MADGKGYGPAVENGKLLYTSPSAINTHESCNRKYFYKYVLRLPDEKSTPAMEYGIALHKRIEHYLQGGADVLGSAERAGLEYIPAPSKDLLVEQKTFEGKALFADGVPIKGSVDLVQIAPGGAPGAVVTDWKSTSKLSNKRTTPASLLDPNNDEGRQMIAYAEWARLNTTALAKAGLMDWIQVRHVQFQIGAVDSSGTASGPFRAREVLSLKVPLETIAGLWQRVEFIVTRVKETARAKRAEDANVDTETCNKYHKPCPYLRVCAAGKVQAAGAWGDLFGSETASEEKDMGLMERLKTLAEDPKPADPAFERLPGVAKSVEELEMLATATAPPPVPKLPPPPPPDDEVFVRADGSVIPPKRGRGRPRKEEATPPAVAPIAVVAVPPVEAVAPPPAVPQAAAYVTYTPPVASEWRLYIGCSPVGVVVQSLEGYVATLEKDVLAKVGETLPDVRLSDKEQLKFGKYKAVLGSFAKQAPPTPGHYAAGYGDERVDAVVAALTSIAAPGCIVRGGGR